MKLWKIENKSDGLVYYYSEKSHYDLAVTSESDFMKRAMVSYIIMPQTNSLIKCQDSLETFFNNFCE